MKKANRNEFIWGWLFILPTMIGLMVLNIIPIFQTIYQSFFKTGDFGKGNVFVGLDNYIRLIHDEAVWQSLINTIKYAVIEVPFSVIIGLLAAVLLNRKMKGRTIFRTIFFLPMVMAPAAVAMVWRWMYNSKFGLLNFLLSKLGLGPVNWISDPKIAIVSIAVVGIWSVIGYNMILFLAGLQEIPADYYEAARIDGASSVRQFFQITVPLISPTMFFVCITRIIAAFQIFDLVFMMMDNTNTALPKTQTLSYLFYKYSFMQNNKGYGSAIVILLLAVILVITFVQMKIEKHINYD
ncbi:multiple sugar transport system permease protein [Lachnospiraceae bacterium PF1-21]|uniref:Sugar ABC transporter permease n=1 Tax=Ohessyouella blattaphilus TaxID=2949333 RepID=A0ABT1EFA0_9FIRM|nr:sugar ABC transporter permease [Ohessyouella blattaphilus]MCP1109387.1 sugar ABC transporter permease [Ohessyouella blattaphilus]MCR8562781.1 sugar ABC transporter permease [Ohessyouella blattaphilus]MDL2249308.1 sugar ABC transporter permease [Lachnospiraceae bacterium OttesenSCG-928-J05]